MRFFPLWAALALSLIAVPAAAGDHSVDEARRILAAGDTLGAIEVLRHCDLERVGDPQWFVLLGRLYREQGTIESRQESQYVLERAVQLFPDDAAVAQEMGLTYFSQTFYPDAARHFERALAIDPDLCLAKHKLGVTHYERWKLRVNAFRDEADQARAWLGRALACDPNNADAAIRYVNVTYALGEPLPASIAARSFAGRFPDTPEFPLVVAAVDYENDNQVGADSAFATALELMGTDEWSAYASLSRNVLGYDDMDKFQDAPLDQQPIMQRAYWIGVDPDPTTDINELHLEHMYRTFRADLFYSNSSVVSAWTRPQTRGWDTERGEFSIKWGWPDDIYASYGGPRMEIWTYENYDGRREPITVPFGDRIGTGNLSVPSARSDVLAMARFMNQVSEPEKRVIESGVLDAVAFKDDDFGCSLYVIMHANADSLLGAIDVATTREYRLRTRFFDENWEVEMDDATTIPAHEMVVLPGSKYKLFDLIRQHRLPFGRYNVACALEDEARTTRAVQRGNCDATHLARSTLTSSDILFLREGTAGASFSRGGELLTPNPWRAYGESQRVGVYFEIYNLAVKERQSRYRLTYEIHEDPDESPSPWDRLGKFVARFTGLAKGDPSLAQSFDRVGDDHRAAERMTIDVSRLPAGPHRLWLTIEDLHTGRVWETARSFIKTEPAVAASE